MIGVIASARTCILMIRTTGNEKEYCDALYKYWGNWAYYLGNISTLLIMLAAVCSYFIMLSQMLYTIILALLDWIFNANMEVLHDPTLSDSFSNFSQAYATLIIFGIECFITNKKDLSIFIKLVSYGVFFIVSLILFIVGVGIYGLADSEFEVTV